MPRNRPTKAASTRNRWARMCAMLMKTSCTRSELAEAFGMTLENVGLNLAALREAGCIVLDDTRTRPPRTVGKLPEAWRWNYGGGMTAKQAAEMLNTIRKGIPNGFHANDIKMALHLTGEMCADESKT